MCAEMFGYAVSEATLQIARQEQYEALEPFEKRLVEILPQEPVLHADETSVMIDKVRHWLHVLCTPLLTFFAIHLSRGKDAIQAAGIIPPHARAKGPSPRQTVQGTELTGPLGRIR